MGPSLPAVLVALVHATADAGATDAGYTEWIVHALEGLADYVGCTWLGSPWSTRPCDDVLDDDAACEDEQTEGTLGSFCGQSFADARLLHCGCCADESAGGLPRRAALLMPGKVTTTTAHHVGENGATCRKGRVPAWSLGGGRQPVAVCDGGRLLCRCARGEWTETTTACRPGEKCLPPAVTSEGHSSASACAGGAVQEGRRVRATVDIYYAADGASSESEEVLPPLQVARANAAWTLPAGSTGRIVQATPRHLAASWDGFESLGIGRVYCGQIAFLSPEDDKAESHKDLRSCTAGSQPRSSIGEVNCSDMDELSCPRVFSGSGGDWHFCHLREGELKICRAAVVLESRANEQAEHWEPWARAWTWDPGRDWKTSRRSDGTLVAASAPSDVVQELLMAEVLREGKVDEGSTSRNEASGAPV